MLIRSEQAAKILDIQVSTLEAWRCRGGGPPFIKYGRAVRYREEDLEKFIEGKIQRNTSENLRVIEVVADR
jgi:predicted site-specific integrase-resolvase